MNKFIKILLNYFLGPALFAILSYSLYKQVVRQPDLAVRWNEIKQGWQSPLFWLACLLMPLNWSLEARKWQILTNHIQPLKFFTALKSVFAGCSISMLMPNRIGEYGGRILFLESQNRLRAITLTIVGSMAQLLITLLIGWLGLSYFMFLGGEKARDVLNLIPGVAWGIIWIGVLSVTLLLLLIYMKVGFIVHWLDRFKKLEKLVKYLRLLEVLNRKELLRILLISFIRYMVFILQFILILRVVQVQIPVITGFWLLSVFYLAMAMAPTIGFTELPIRAATSAQLLGVFSSNLLGIQAASLGIWVINLVIPAIIGSLLVLGLKVMKD